MKYFINTTFSEYNFPWIKNSTKNTKKARKKQPRPHKSHTRPHTTTQDHTRATQEPHKTTQEPHKSYKKASKLPSQAVASRRAEERSWWLRWWEARISLESKQSARTFRRSRLAVVEGSKVTTQATCPKKRNNN